MDNLDIQKTNSSQLPTKSSEPSLETAIQSIARIQNEGRLDLAKAMHGRQLSYYKRESGEGVLGPVLTAIILSINASFNIGKPMTELQAAEAAKAVLKEKWYMKLAELYLFAEKAKNGDFGKVYDRFDRAILFEWLNKWDEIREDHVFAEMNGRNETDDAPEIDEETQKLNQEKADKALSDLSQKLKTEYGGGSLRDKLTDHDFKKYALEYELSRPKPEESESKESKPVMP